MVALSLRERVHLIARGLMGTMNVEPGSAGGQMLSRVWPGAVGDPPKRGTAEFLAAYSTSPWLRAVESRISAATAAVQWQLFYVKRPTAAKAIRCQDIQRAPFTVRKSLLKEREDAGDLVEVKEHPWLTAMERGNPYLTGLTLRKLTQIYLDTVGDCFWIKERNALGVPSAFWPIPPTWILSTPTLSHRVFRVSFRSWQGDIPDTEILWMCDPDPVNPYGRGSGIASAVSDELDTDEAAAKHVRSFLWNRARPDLIISPKGDDTLTPANVTRLEQEWVGKHQGFWKAFKPFFATRQIEVTQLDQNFQHLQMVELRKHERDMILQVTGGIPPEKLGIVEGSNRATIEAADYIMSKDIVVPRLEFQRSYYQEKLMPEYDDRLIVDYVSPVAEDKTAQLEAAKAAPFAPTVDEWREWMGLPALTTGGDVHMVPINLTPMDTFEPAPIDLSPNPAEVVPPAA